MLTFSRREVEGDLNKNMPQYTAQVKNKDEEYTIHFAGIWSDDKDAVPLLLIHGWPGKYPFLNAQNVILILA